MKHRFLFLATVLLAVLIVAPAVTASNVGGSASVGYVYVDDEGNRSVHQPTYNLYEGLSLSLEDFYYVLDNGLRFYGDLQDVTLNNRNLRFGMSKPGVFGINLRNNQYRRTYSFDSGTFTRRNRTNAQAWFKPHQYIRLFGGYGFVDKHGSMAEFFEPIGSDPLRQVDYSHSYYNAGVTVGHNRRYATLEFLGTDYTDDITPLLNDRTSQRYRLTAVSPVPAYENFVLHMGLQRYEHAVDEREDTLKANTFWGGARAYFDGGWSGRYSFIWDRARRTGDLVSTDNIIHAVYADKVFKGIAGITLGYQYGLADDVSDETQTTGYVGSVWVRPVPNLTLRAGHGSEELEVQSGNRLTGDEERTRIWGQAKYKYEYGAIRAKVEDKSTENEDIGSKADFTRVSTDLSANYPDYGTFMVGYAYYNGEFENAGGLFTFEEHVVSGDILSAPYKKFQAGFGGHYYRSRLDVDVESFTVRLKGLYHFMEKHAVEVIYSAHNFDDFNDPAINNQLVPYSKYYTANVVEVNLIHEF